MLNGNFVVIDLEFWYQPIVSDMSEPIIDA